ncbi:MAG: glycosyltransferase family A protein, partial [Bacteroidota bacterium]
KENEIKNTLDSVLKQTFQDFEIIIVNDGSTDNSLINARSVLDDRISIYSTENLGVSHARNYGIEKSHANYIAFLDADDLWYFNHLAELKNLILDFPGCGMYCKAYEKNYYNKYITPANYNDLDKKFRGIINDYFKHSLIDSVAWTSGLALPKSVIDTVGNFDERLGSVQDTDLWIRISLNHKLAFDRKISVRRHFGTEGHLSKFYDVNERSLFLKNFKNLQKNNASLKKFMDYNRFAYAIQRKLKGDLKTCNKIISDIDSNNLNLKRKLLIKLPSKTLKVTKIIQESLVRKGWYLSPFK